jgi:hypothetical protein
MEIMNSSDRAPDRRHLIAHEPHLRRKHKRRVSSLAYRCGVAGCGGHGDLEAATSRVSDEGAEEPHRPQISTPRSDTVVDQSRERGWQFLSECSGWIVLQACVHEHGLGLCL